MKEYVLNPATQKVEVREKQPVSEPPVALRRLVRRIFHDWLGWHDNKGQAKTGWDGCSFTGRCSCGKRVLQDSWGNWFEVSDSPNAPLQP